MNFSMENSGQLFCVGRLVMILECECWDGQMFRLTIIVSA